MSACSAREAFLRNLQNPAAGNLMHLGMKGMIALYKGVYLVARVAALAMRIQDRLQIPYVVRRRMRRRRSCQFRFHNHPCVEKLQYLTDGVRLYDDALARDDVDQSFELKPLQS